jgi:hypothetical protein
MNIKLGSRWAGAGYRQIFVVLAEVKIDDAVWIHYREDLAETVKEYSCYKDSYLSRFTPLPE